MERSSSNETPKLTACAAEKCPFIPATSMQSPHAATATATSASSSRPSPSTAWKIRRSRFTAHMKTQEGPEQPEKHRKTKHPEAAALACQRAHDTVTHVILPATCFVPMFPSRRATPTSHAHECDPLHLLLNHIPVPLQQRFEPLGTTQLRLVSLAGLIRQHASAAECARLF
jgi:hypothetical protein